MAYKCILWLAVGFLAVIAATASKGNYKTNEELYLSQPLLQRHVRSPEGGSVDVSVNKDQGGKSASVQYNHNLYSSSDGRGTIDAYAQASRNFDHNQNSYGGGIRGSWRF